MLDDQGRTPLLYATVTRQMEVVQVLLAAGADASLQCQGHRFPLEVAIGVGHVGITRVLLEHGEDANAARVDGYAPLHIAADCDKPDMVPLLCLNGADVDRASGRRETPLQVAVRKRHDAAARALLAAGADANLKVAGSPHESAFNMVALQDHADMLRTMIEHGADVNATRLLNVTAIHMAAYCGRTAVVEVLLRAGADTEVRMDGTGNTPLLDAATRNNASPVLLLLKYGASVGAQNQAGETPLHRATAKAGSAGTADVVDLLLKHGADEKAIDSAGKTPVDGIGSKVNEQDSVAEDVERVRKLLAKASADRAWRRRRFLVLCRAHYPSGRVQLGQGGNLTYDTGMARRTRSNPEPSRAENEWAGVASMLIGVGADPISLMGDGADIIFETIVRFL